MSRPPVSTAAAIPKTAATQAAERAPHAVTAVPVIAVAAARRLPPAIRDRLNRLVFSLGGIMTAD